ncbi:VOC family protein [candidate division KSB1 bacterium]
MYKYHHIGIPTQTPQKGEIYLEKYKIFATDHESNPFGIQWMRYEKDCELPEIVKNLPHVAFEVDDLEKALEGKEVIIEPNSPSEDVVVAFILDNGAPVEFLEFRNKT